MQFASQTIDPSILNELQSGEQLLWWGRPDPQRQVKQSHAFTYIFLGLLIAALAYLLYFCFANYFATQNRLLLVPVFLVTCMLALLVFTFYAFARLYYKIASDLLHTTYAITNQRIIVIIANRQGPSVTSHTAEDMGTIQTIETDDGWGDVSFGSPHPFSVGSARTTVIDKLSGIPSVRTVEDLLIRTFKQPPAQQAWEYPQVYPPIPRQYEPFLPQE